MKHLIPLLGIALGIMLSIAAPKQALAQKKIENPDITINVAGLACPFCAYGLEKKLKKLDGVAAIYVNIDEGQADIKLKKETTLAEANIKKAVEDAGFTLTKVTYANESAKPDK
ncbi:MAG: heavy-metal-associated domain-containing protein [Gracilimonas sp.]|jgi:mercuric ion binding protein|uniref:heavy-metal-associated domain-containing protein n=1 Tax=Gracilimonas sp. TaxID=1974203 RepID=UPI0037533E87|nr:heavy-metal-associated domain-containing protein [Gracilimonas sp.]